MKETGQLPETRADSGAQTHANDRPRNEPEARGQQGPIGDGPSSVLFTEGDFRNFPSLAAKLKGEPSDAISKYLNEKLSPETREALRSYASSDSKVLEGLLLKDLNRIIVSAEPIFDSSLLADVALRPGTKWLLAQNPREQHLRRLNRHLLEDAYPLELSPLPATKIGQDGRPLRVFAFGGGAFETVSQLGVVHALMVANARPPDLVAGISAGAVNAVALAEILQAGQNKTSAERQVAQVAKFREVLETYRNAPIEMISNFLPDMLEVQTRAPLEPQRLPIHFSKEREEREDVVRTRSGLIRLCNDLLAIPLDLHTTTLLIRLILELFQAEEYPERTKRFWETLKALSQLWWQLFLKFRVLTTPPMRVIMNVISKATFELMWKRLNLKRRSESAIKPEKGRGKSAKEIILESKQIWLVRWCNWIRREARGVLITAFFLSIFWPLASVWKLAKSLRKPTYPTKESAAEKALGCFLQSFLRKYNLSQDLATPYLLKQHFVRLFDPRYYGPIDLKKVVEAALQQRDEGIQGEGSPKPLKEYYSTEAQKHGTAIYTAPMAANVEEGKIEALPQTTSVVDALLAAAARVPLFRPKLIHDAGGFSAEDIKDLPGLALKLKNPTLPLSRYLMKRLSEGTRELLRAEEGSALEQKGLRTAFAEEFKEIIEGKPIYHRDLFTGIQLRARTRQLLKHPEDEKKLGPVNRWLLEDAYPLEIVRSEKLYIDGFNISNRTVQPLVNLLIKLKDNDSLAAITGIEIYPFSPFRASEESLPDGAKVTKPENNEIVAKTRMNAQQNSEKEKREQKRKQLLALIQEKESKKKGATQAEKKPLQEDINRLQEQADKENELISKLDEEIAANQEAISRIEREDKQKEEETEQIRQVRARIKLKKARKDKFKRWMEGGNAAKPRSDGNLLEAYIKEIEADLNQLERKEKRLLKKRQETSTSKETTNRYLELLAIVSRALQLQRFQDANLERRLVRAYRKALPFVSRSRDPFVPMGNLTYVRFKFHAVETDPLFHINKDIFAAKDREERRQIIDRTVAIGCRAAMETLLPETFEWHETLQFIAEKIKGRKVKLDQDEIQFLAKRLGQDNPKGGFDDPLSKLSSQTTAAITEHRRSVKGDQGSRDGAEILQHIVEDLIANKVFQASDFNQIRVRRETEVLCEQLRRIDQNSPERKDLRHAFTRLLLEDAYPFAFQRDILTLLWSKLDRTSRKFLAESDLSDATQLNPVLEEIDRILQETLLFDPRSAEFKNAQEWLLSVKDFKALGAFARKLLQQADPVSRFLKDHLTGVTLEDLSKCGNGEAVEPEAGNRRETREPLAEQLTDSLNTLIRGDCIFEPTRFEGVSLRPETRLLLAQEPAGKELAHLNRLLLEDAYPDELARDHFFQEARALHDQLESFLSDCFKDIASLARKLQQASDPVSSYILGRLSNVTHRALAQFRATGSDTGPLKECLRKDLNKLIEGGSLYESGVFSAVELGSDTNKLLAEDNSVRVNWGLLGSACPELKQLAVLEEKTESATAGTSVQLKFRQLEAERFAAFVRRLRSPCDPISVFITDNLSQPTRQSLEAEAAAPSQELKDSLQRDLNQILHSGFIYERERFGDLEPETEQLLARYPKEDLIRLNRELIEDAYPEELEKHSQKRGELRRELNRLVLEHHYRQEALESQKDQKKEQLVSCRTAVALRLGSEKVNLPGSHSESGPGIADICLQCALYRAQNGKSQEQSLRIAKARPGEDRPTGDWPVQNGSADSFCHPERSWEATSSSGSDKKAVEVTKGTEQNWPVTRDSTQDRRARPTITLLLSGGVFRGVFQVGVINALRLSHVAPDLIAGSSVGSIIGALAAKVFSTPPGNQEEKLRELAALFLAFDRLILTDRFADFVRRFTLRAATANFSLKDADQFFRQYDVEASDLFSQSARRVIAGLERLFYLSPFDLLNLTQALRNRKTQETVGHLRDHLQRFLDHSDVGQEILGAEPLLLLIQKFIMEESDRQKGAAPFDLFGPKGIQLLATVTNLTRGELKILSSLDPDVQKAALAEGLLASSAFPALFRPRWSWEVLAASKDVEQYVDGGLLDNLPLTSVVKFLDNAAKKGWISARPVFEGEHVPHLLFTASLEPRRPMLPEPDLERLVESWPEMMRRAKQLRYNRKIDAFAWLEETLRSIYEWRRENHAGQASDPASDQSPLLDLEAITAKPDWLPSTFAFHPMLGFRQINQAASIAHGCAATLLALHECATRNSKWLQAWGIESKLAAESVQRDERTNRSFLKPVSQEPYCWYCKNVQCPFSLDEASNSNPRNAAIRRIYMQCKKRETHAPPARKPSGGA